MDWMNILDLFRRINEFIENYGGTRIAPDDPRSLEIISDFALTIGMDIKLTLVPMGQSRWTPGMWMAKRSK
jgi:hypothetical protein